MSRKPTLVLVPGAWHTPNIWDKVVSLMEAQDYKCVKVALPSVSSNPSVSLLDDIEATRKSIMAETTQGHDVVVVVHSYGGFVGNSSVKGLTRPKEDKSLSSKGTDGHVVGIILIASGFNPTGRSFLELLGGQPPPLWKADTENGFAVLAGDSREMFYHDLPEEEGNYWVGKLEKQALKPLAEGGEHSYAGWMDVPVWSLVTTEDKSFPLDAQRAVVQFAEAAGADVTMRDIQSSHSPMLSKPKETVDLILEAVGYFINK